MNRSLLIALLVLLAVPPQRTVLYDLAIIHGTIVDGSGGAPRRADVAVRGGTIVAIGSIDPATARLVVDAAGRFVTPGFIDVHTHADDIADTPRAENFVRMGVTTIVAGNCGSSPLDIG